MTVVVNLFHTDLGGAGLPPMLVLHGLLGSSRNWQTTGRDLTTQFHVFALDARNHGKSPHAPEMNYAVLVQDIVGWMDAQGIAQATVVGHSMGGKTGMLLACRHPERVTRFVCVDIAPKDYYWVAHRGEFAAMNELDLINLKTRQEAELRFEARVDNLGMRKFLTTNLERAPESGWRWMVNLPVLTAALPAMEKNSLAADDRYEGPALFIAGGHSAYIQSSDHETIRRYFPHAQIEVIPQSGHNPHMEQREAFVQLVMGKDSGLQSDANE